jgi:hypothetical protein
MVNTKPALRRPGFFVSAKTSAPIPARCGLLWEALVLASLDGDVRSIHYVASAVVASRPIELGAIVLERDDGRFTLDVVPARRVRSLEEEGLALIAMSDLGLSSLTITEEEIGRQPRRANARLVWSYNGVPVPIGLRVRILQALTDEGPMQLGRLLETVRSERDPAPAVMALACANVVELDLESGPLGPSTTARSRA